MLTAALAPLHVESAGRGRPLVLLHGWALHAGLFAPLVPALASAHRVHAVDLPGHGRSAPLPRWSITDVVAQLDERFAAEGAIDVLGWSLGATCALAWARAHPARIRRLVLVAATPRFAAGDDWPHALPRAALRRFADGLRSDGQATLRRFCTLQAQGGDDGRATLHALRRALRACGAPDPSGLAEALAAFAACDLRDDVPAIRQPALVVAGDRDTLVPAAASRWLARTLPHATLAEVGGAAHVPFLSHRDAFAAAVQPFLDRP